MEVWRIVPGKFIVIPMAMGFIPAGFPSPAADYIENSIDLNKLLISNQSSTFYAQVQGNSMIGAFIHPTATHLIVDRSLEAKHRDIIVAVVNGEFTVKRFLKTDKGIILAAENPKYQPIPLSEYSDAAIWGVVTYFITDAKKV